MISSLAREVDVANESSCLEPGCYTYLQFVMFYSRVAIMVFHIGFIFLLLVTIKSIPTLALRTPAIFEAIDSNPVCKICIYLLVKCLKDLKLYVGR